MFLPSFLQAHQQYAVGSRVDGVCPSFQVCEEDMCSFVCFVLFYKISCLRDFLVLKKLLSKVRLYLNKGWGAYRTQKHMCGMTGHSFLAAHLILGGSVGQRTGTRASQESHSPPCLPQPGSAGLAGPAHTAPEVTRRPPGKSSAPSTELCMGVFHF